MRTEEVFERVVRSRKPLFRVNRMSSGSAVDVRSTVEGHVGGRKGAEASGGCGMPWWCESSIVVSCQTPFSVAAFNRSEIHA